MSMGLRGKHRKRRTSSGGGASCIINSKVPKTGNGKKLGHNETAESTSLGFHIAKPQADLNYASFAKSHATDCQLVEEKGCWEKLWTRDTEGHGHQHYQQTGQVGPLEQGPQRQPQGRFKKNTSGVDCVHPGMMMKKIDDRSLEVLGK